jgi:heterodisulfide reductase subunit B
LPVYFITELLGIAMGFSPKEMQLNRHFIDPLGHLMELKLI